MRQLSILISLAIVGAAPLVAGGNRPLVWALAAVGIGIAGLFCFATPAGLSSRSLRSLVVPGVVASVFLLWATIQAIPLPGLSGAATTSGGAQINSPTLSFSPADTLLSAMTMATAALLFLVLSQTTRSARALLAILFAMASAQALWGVVSLRFLGDTLLGAEKSQYQGFATGTFVNRSAFADYAGTALPIGVCLIARQWLGVLEERVDGRRLFLTSLLVAGMAVSFVGVLASGSRMALFAVVSSTSICVLLLAFRYRLQVPAGWLLLVAVLLGAVLLVVFGAGLTDRTFDLAQDAAVRSELYRQVWAAILRSPWTGYGGGSFPVVFPIFEASPLPGQLIWSKAHSTYLSLFFEYGLVGGALPILAVGVLVLLFAWSVVRSRGGYAQIAAIGVAAMFGIHALVDFGLEMQGNALMLAAVLGVASGALAASRKQTIAGSVSASEGSYSLSSDNRSAANPGRSLQS
jgi:O-antigen ligase